ncbi:MAG: hypothetical protein Q4G26_16760 [Paracoccus sp. (in: a-proteobacteria)]|nr:hypothetical protein [Paracoccus sp. (in: a-proteobacteria)]
MALFIFSLLAGVFLGWRVWIWSGGDPFPSFAVFLGGFYGIYIGLAIAIHELERMFAKRNRKG